MLNNYIYVYCFAFTKPKMIIAHPLIFIELPIFMAYTYLAYYAKMVSKSMKP